MECRALHMVGKCSISRPHPSSDRTLYIYIIYSYISSGLGENTRLLSPGTVPVTSHLSPFILWQCKGRCISHIQLMRELCVLMHVVGGQPLMLFLGITFHLVVCFGQCWETSPVWIGWMDGHRALGVRPQGWDYKYHLHAWLFPLVLGFELRFSCLCGQALSNWAIYLPSQGMVFVFVFLCVPWWWTLASPSARQALCLWAPSPAPREIVLWPAWYLCQLWVIIFSLLSLPGLPPASGKMCLQLMWHQGQQLEINAGPCPWDY